MERECKSGLKERGWGNRKVHGTVKQFILGREKDTGLWEGIGKRYG